MVSSDPQLLSIVSGKPLEDEQGIGALTLGGYVREIATRFGTSEAMVMSRADRCERWTYDDVLAKSLEVARALVACGVGKGTPVGILQTNRPEFLASLFGTAMVGGIATTISTFFTPPELATVLRMSCCSVLLMDAQVLSKDYGTILTDLEPALREVEPGQLLSGQFPFLRHVVSVDPVQPVRGVEPWQQFLARGAAIPEQAIAAMADCISPSDPAVLFFSSGSTGKPKGILSAHRAVCLQLWRWPVWYRLDEPPRTWVANGFFWSGNFAMALGGTLSTGGSLVLQRWFDAEEAIRLMEQEQASMLVAWPHQWAQLVAAPNYADADLSSLVYVDATSPVAQHPTVQTTWLQPANSFGSTETFTLISVHTPESAVIAHPTSHGVPTHGSTIKIIDPFTGATVSRGERGEIAVKGPTLMLGYLGIPLDRTLDDAGFLRTGDGGYIDDNGHLVWEGRLNDIVKTGGANVSPIEVDDVIRLHPEVKVTQTIGVPDELLGELLVTCIVPHDRSRLTEHMIQRFARERLASYKVPRRVLFLSEGQLSTTGSAKIKLDDLRTLAATLIEASAARPSLGP